MPFTMPTALRAVLNGTSSAFADAAMLTTAAALIVAGKVSDLTSGVVAAREARSGWRADSRPLPAGRGIKRVMATILDKIAAYKRDGSGGSKGAPAPVNLRRMRRHKPSPGFRRCPASQTCGW